MAQYKFKIKQKVLFDMRVPGVIIRRQKITPIVHEYLVEAEQRDRTRPIWCRTSELSANE